MISGKVATMICRLHLKTWCFLAQTARTPKADRFLKSFLGEGPELSTPWRAEPQTQTYFPKEAALSKAIKETIQEKKYVTVWKEKKINKAQ